MTKAKVIPLKPSEPPPQYEPIDPRTTRELLVGLIAILKTVPSVTNATDLAHAWILRNGAMLVARQDLPPDHIRTQASRIRRQKRKGLYLLHWRELEGCETFVGLEEVAAYLEMPLLELRRRFAGVDQVDLFEGQDQHGNPYLATIELVPFDRVLGRQQEILAKQRQG